MRSRRGNSAGLVTALLLAVGAGLIPAGPAAAQEGSAFDQYIENSPGPGGEVPTHVIVFGTPDPLSPAAAEALDQAGPSGERAVQVAERLTPQPDDGRKGRREETEDGVSATIGELLEFETDGLGILLPLILAGTVIAGLAYALGRRIRRDELAAG